MTDTTSDIRREMAATRGRMAGDVDELKDHITSPLRAAKQKLDVTHVVRENPWSALGAAVVLGAVVAATGTDSKATRATGTSAKRAAKASKKAASAAMEKLHSSDPHEAPAASESSADNEKPGWSARLF